jgi:glycosyltransferase involved in cell wall biosynthesis
MAEEAAPPKISVSLVVPMRDEEDSIAALIRSILDQAFIPTEVILVDAGSRDCTAAVAHELTAKDPRFHILEAGPAWPGKARNFGVRAASCQWIAFTDAGITLDRNWLNELRNTVERNPDLDVVYGNFEPEIATLLDRCALLTYVTPKLQRGGQDTRGPFIASSLIRKSVIEAVGEFPDFRAAEDLIFMEKIEKQGCRIAWQPLAKVEWSLPATLTKTFARFRLYSRHNVYAGRQRYWHYGVLRFYICAAAAALAVFFLNWRWSVLALPLALAARALKSIWLRRQGWSLLSLLNPMQFLFVIVLWIVLDAATFTGWIEAGMDRLFKRGFFAEGPSQPEATPEKGKG